MANKFKLAEAYFQLSIPGYGQFLSKVNVLKTKTSGVGVAFSGFGRIAGRVLMGLLSPIRLVTSAIGRMARMLTHPFALLAGVGLGGLGVGMLTRKMLQLSATAQETEQRFRITMGDMADDTERWIQKTSKLFGRWQADIKEGTTLWYIFLRSSKMSEKSALELSKTLEKLALDYASYFEVPDIEAMQAMASGLQKIIRPMRRFGLELSEHTVYQEAVRLGWKESEAELSKLMDMVARVSLMQRHAAVLGDLTRTQNSYVNMNKRMQASLKSLGQVWGDVIRPLFTGLLDVISAIAEKLSELTVKGLPEGSKGIKDVATVLHKMAEDIRALKPGKVWEGIKDIWFKVKDVLVIGAKLAGLKFLEFAEKAAFRFAKIISQELGMGDLGEFIGVTKGTWAVLWKRLTLQDMGKTDVEIAQEAMKKGSGDVKPTDYRSLIAETMEEWKEKIESLGEVIGPAGTVEERNKAVKEQWEQSNQAIQAGVEEALGAVKKSIADSFPKAQFIEAASLQKHYQDMLNQQAEKQIKLDEERNRKLNDIEQAIEEFEPGPALLGP